MAGSANFALKLTGWTSTSPPLATHARPARAPTKLVRSGRLGSPARALDLATTRWGAPSPLRRGRRARRQGGHRRRGPATGEVEAPEPATGEDPAVDGSMPSTGARRSRGKRTEEEAAPLPSWRWHSAAVVGVRADLEDTLVIVGAGGGGVN
uniref:Uncharacterized protein n=1 Tax=Leersia perrieri TaxID=77586 RepID=A0A0D9WNP5_9ORYZ